ncbi:MAG: TIGR00266 family protein [Flavobacteriales bacterium]|nr:TIGR00266 family protein [Flavobacteriales bacterium]MBK6946062.1 TIGR00266 family protein [Flavobacteriales bacterium]MBK7296827.1 TIGR00266 family protein [Flavobacteriales bacterium]MBK9536895.1 TIGR00266 family protein [Flavobacteriales bacterium]MBP9138976.1 TIGR00266 family protein [Flavobacteriales bacterium]
MTRQAHELDHRIVGDDMQCVEITLDPHETVIAEASTLMMMDDGIEMKTIFGDGRGQPQSFLDKMIGAGKRVLTGESLFMTTYTNISSARRTAWFAAAYPGKIMPLDLRDYHGKLICQKDSFLCAAKGVSIGIAFQRKLGAGLFGGEGFIMQSLEGDGQVYIHAGGTTVQRELQSGETLKVDTGCLVCMTQTVNYDIKMVGGIKNTLFGGEGLFFATLTGPGHVWIQSLPFSRLADNIIAAAPRAGGKGKEEGSLLGGIGRLLDGDN